MPLTPTPHLNLIKAADDETDWGDGYRSNLDVLDAAVQRIDTDPLPAEVFAFDYGTHTDDSPVYFGKARPGSIETATVWTVTKFFYDGTRLDHTEVRTGLAWSARATPIVAWSS